MKHCLENAIVSIIAVAGMWVAAEPSFAHHLWVQEKDWAYVVCRGAIGKRLDPYNPLCVTQISAKAPDETVLTITRTNEKKAGGFYRR